MITQEEQVLSAQQWVDAKYPDWRDVIVNGTQDEALAMNTKIAGTLAASIIKKDGPTISGGVFYERVIQPVLALREAAQHDGETFLPQIYASMLEFLALLKELGKRIKRRNDAKLS